jgi:hypothetical protein
VKRGLPQFNSGKSPEYAVGTNVKRIKKDSFRIREVNSIPY